MRMCSQVSPRGGKRGVHRSRRLDENARMGCIKKKEPSPGWSRWSLCAIFRASVIESERG